MSEQYETLLPVNEKDNNLGNKTDPVYALELIKYSAEFSQKIKDVDHKVDLLSKEVDHLKETIDRIEKKTVSKDEIRTMINDVVAENSKNSFTRAHGYIMMAIAILAPLITILVNIWLNNK